MGGSTTKRISGTAFQALREALSYVFWYKPTLEKYLRDALREHSELLRDIDFNAKKRQVADDVVDRLREREFEYQTITIQLMIELAHMDRFPELENHENKEKWLPKAETAVANLRRHVELYESLVSERERVAAELKAKKADQDLQRRFEDDLSTLHQDFLSMHQMSDKKARGYAFEAFLNSLFTLFDLDPRLGYSERTEQIDGALSFDTDDYILEAKWTEKPLSREKADAFNMKVRRKGKNALGLVVSINGISKSACEAYSRESSFMVLDGMDLMWVLEGRNTLDEILRRKKRHVNETGECFYPVSRIYRTP